MALLITREDDFLTRGNEQTDGGMLNEFIRTARLWLPVLWFGTLVQGGRKRPCWRDDQC